MRFAIPLLLVLVGCGGSSPTPNDTSSSSTKSAGANDTPGDKCLAIAGAKRDRKPDEPAKITVKHILVKHKGSKRVVATITRTREEACLRALEARAKLEAGASFAEMVATYSEEQGAASREGSIGAIGRADVAAPFADAAFELARGDVSHIVETDFGFHIIVRTE